jgi:hypothetical protein
VATQAFSGGSQRQALFRAADFAVERVSGLKGFFASKLAFIVERRQDGGAHRRSSLRRAPDYRDNSQALKPRWSPDGRKLLYTSYFKNGFPDIYQIDLSSLQRTSFVTFRGTNSSARYSPNGQQVAMVLSGEVIRDLREQRAGPTGGPAYADGCGRGFPVLFPGRIPVDLYLRCGGRTAALHHARGGRVVASPRHQHQRLLCGAGLEPRQPRPDRLHRPRRTRLPRSRCTT